MMGIFIDQKFEPKGWDDVNDSEIEVRNAGVKGLKDMNSDALKAAHKFFTFLINTINTELTDRKG